MRRSTESIAVVLVANRRSDYTIRALRALRIARYPGIVRVSIDHSNEHPDASEAVYTAVNAARGLVVPRYNNPPLGIWNAESNHKAAINWGFEELTTKAVLLIEDDCVVSPDALALCEWFLENCLPEFAVLSLGHSNDGNWRYHEGHEIEIVHSTGLLSPWASLWPRATWETLREVWNTKQAAPYGWDWNYSFWGAIYRWKTAVPCLSRARNIGAKDGTNGDAAWWQEHFGDLVISDGTWGTEYRLLPAPELRWHQSWMDAELSARGLQVDW